MISDIEIRSQGSIIAAKFFEFSDGGVEWQVWSMGSWRRFPTLKDLLNWWRDSH